MGCSSSTQVKDKEGTGLTLVEQKDPNAPAVDAANDEGKGTTAPPANDAGKQDVDSSGQPQGGAAVSGEENNAGKDDSTPKEIDLANDAVKKDVDSSGQPQGGAAVFGAENNAGKDDSTPPAVTDKEIDPAKDAGKKDIDSPGQPQEVVEDTNPEENKAGKKIVADPPQDDSGTPQVGGVVTIPAGSSAGGTEEIPQGGTVVTVPVTVTVPEDKKAGTTSQEAKPSSSGVCSCCRPSSTDKDEVRIQEN